MKQQRYVVMLPLPLKRRLKQRAADLGVPMRTLLIDYLEDNLGTDWRNEAERPPGTQRLLEESA